MEPIDINAPTTPKITPDLAKSPTGPLRVDNYVSNEKTHLQPVRTFSTDLANAVREKGGSIARIAIAEDEKNRREKEETSISSRKNILFTSIGIILFATAVGAIIWSYLYTKQASVVAPVQQTAPSSIVYTENNQTIDATGMDAPAIVSTINAIVTAPNIQSGTMKNIVITQSSVRIPGSQFLTAIGAIHAPDDFLRSLAPEYMLGTYLYNQDSLFLVIRGTAHDFLLSGMISWEPFLLKDLAPLFAIDTATNPSILNAKWNDTFIENRNARAIVDANNKPILFYSFLDQNTILFATDPKALTAVVARF